jgi:WG containing repeat
MICQAMFAQENALVRQDDKFGYISKSGNFKIEPQFKVAKNFSDGLAAVEKGGKWGFINAMGNCTSIFKC